MRAAIGRCFFTVFVLATAAFMQAQTPLTSSNFSTLDGLLQACSTAGRCDVTVDGPQELLLTHTLRLPATLHLRFTGAGHWTLHGGTLDFANAHIDAGPNQIFDGDTRLLNLADARPEWFAQPVNGVYPPIALASAYHSTVANGTILLDSARYVSPFTAAPGGSHLLYDSPRLFVGTATPQPDSETDPTHLVNGSILVGELRGSAAFRAVNLGVDDGPEAAAYFNGYRGFGLVIESRGVLGAVSGSRLKNISVLTTGVSDQHSVMFSGQRDVAIDGLWLWTLGGIHGLVIKSYDVIVQNFHCKGASGDCLTVKSDYATDHQGYSANVRFSDIFLSYLKTRGDTGGISIDSRWDEVHSVAFTRLHEDGVAVGIVAGGSWFHTMRGLAVDQWDATNIQGPCLVLERARDIVLTHSVCNGTNVVPVVVASSPDKARLKLHLRILYTVVETRLHERPFYFLALAFGVLWIAFLTNSRRKFTTSRQP